MKRQYLVAGVVSLFASVANAAVLDFTIPTSGFTVESYTDAAGSTAPDFTGGSITSEAGFDSILLDVDGIDLDISITDIADGNPYFDADSGGRPGGLGSCRVLTSSAQCSPSSDDNLTISANETISMSFLNDAAQAVDVLFGEFLFHDDDHRTFTGRVQVSHDDGSSIISVVDGIADFSVIGATDFLIFNDAPGATNNYYISSMDVSQVPVPAAVWLFASALGLLGMRKRS